MGVNLRCTGHYCLWHYLLCLDKKKRLNKHLLDSSRFAQVGFLSYNIKQSLLSAPWGFWGLKAYKKR